ncbi:hypothetical protein PHPALM_30377 [Phytophthora palmivora]|uniref:Uncharacterized protein n=1 Tax=Phytophthora palmivora TaxID=4796 RepID=A0A2P4X5B9_9STRA|nr:hypothetical protein PHPALM_30377 [Phytophthora palmivora]
MSIHEEFVLELETDDDEEDDEDYEEEMGHQDDEVELEAVVEMLPEAAKAKGKSKAKRQRRPKAKTLRKPVAAQLAKEDKEARRSAAEQRCISSVAAELEGADERERAKKKIGESKKTKKKAERLPPSTPPQSRYSPYTRWIIQYALTNDVVCHTTLYNMIKIQQAKRGMIQHLRMEKDWRELRKDEMIAFVQDNDSMMEMRASGWEFGTC